MEKREFMMRDLEKNKHQSSWDWDADLRFVTQFYAEKEESLRDILNSASPYSMRIAAYEIEFEAIRKERLKILRNLVKSGFAKASWTGTGFMGSANFGLKRVRVYTICEPC